MNRVLPRASCSAWLGGLVGVAVSAACTGGTAVSWLHSTAAKSIAVPIFFLRFAILSFLLADRRLSNVNARCVSITLRAPGIFGVPCKTPSADFRPATYASQTIGEGGGSRGISAASYYARTELLQRIDD